MNSHNLSNFVRSRLRIRPVAFVENDAQFVERQLENMNEQIRAGALINQFSVKPVHNPFFIELDSTKSSIKAWVVDINKFYSKLEKSIFDSIYSDESSQLKFLNDCCKNTHHTTAYSLDLCEKVLKYDIPNDCVDEFNQIQAHNKMRNFYHLVIVLYRDKSDLESLNRNDVVVNINIYHLKDEKMETRLIHNYLKCVDNRIISLTKIKAETENLCVVCQSNEANQVLLPCTHKCLCSECFQRVLDKKCPLCRTQIHNKFEIGS